jgi:tripartite-type tricarboxylate transporter receptor subunit TctC
MEPHKIVIGTNGAGTLTHVAAQLLIDRSGAPMTVLPYATGGIGAATADLIGGRIHVVIDTQPALKGVLDAGSLKALALMSRERRTNAPDLPTASETVPGLTAIGWIALVAPKGTPDGIVRQLREDLRYVLGAAETRAKLAPIANPFRPLFGDELARFIAAEQKQWWPVVRATLGAK